MTVWHRGQVKRTFSKLIPLETSSSHRTPIRGMSRKIGENKFLNPIFEEIFKILALEPTPTQCGVAAHNDFCPQEIVPSKHR